MHERVGQLAFAFPAEPRFEREDFLVSDSNEAAYGAIEAWPDWPDSVLVLTGPAGVGKSHLAAIFAARSGARRLSAEAVELARVEDAAAPPAFVVDDADRTKIDETAWFHFLNVLRARRTGLLVVARDAPSAWPIRMPDLVSRLRLAPHAAIAPADDPLLRAVLVKLFLDRQLIVDTGVIETMVRRSERSVPAMRQLVEELDRAALAARRRVTPAFVAQFLAERAEPDEAHHD